jgi:hypothetical protein
MVSTERAAIYLTEYIARYRDEYDRFTAPPPNGGGYPRIPISPYQYGGELVCHLAADGAVILDSSNEPAYRWDVAGGPALMVDHEPTRTPAWVNEVLRAEGILGKNIGISRIVGKSPIPDHVWRGSLGEPRDRRRLMIDNLSLEVCRYEYPWQELIQRLTYGAFGLILDVKLPDINTDFWHPYIVTGIPKG